MFLLSHRLCMWVHVKNENVEHFCIKNVRRAHTISIQDSFSFTIYKPVGVVMLDLTAEWMDGSSHFRLFMFFFGVFVFWDYTLYWIEVLQSNKRLQTFFFTSHQNITSLCQVKSQISTRRKFSTLVPCLPLPALFSKWNESLWWVSSRFGASPNSSSIIHLFSVKLCEVIACRILLRQ